MDYVYPRYQVAPATGFMEMVRDAPANAGLRLRIAGTTLEGKDVSKTVLLPLGAQDAAPKRLAGAGLTVMAVPEGVQIAAVGLHSKAEKAGLEQGFMVTGIETSLPRPSQEWIFVPAMLLLGGVVLLQRRRGPPAATRPLATPA
jgi:hypothetical protein